MLLGGEAPRLFELSSGLFDEEALGPAPPAATDVAPLGENEQRVVLWQRQALGPAMALTPGAKRLERRRVAPRLREEVGPKPEAVRPAAETEPL